MLLHSYKIKFMKNNKKFNFKADYRYFMNLKKKIYILDKFF